MKKLLLILIFINLTLSVFSQEQIGDRLRYEVRSGQIWITDVFDNDKTIIFYFGRAINNNIYIYFNHSRVGTINIYTRNFKPFITQHITSWSASNGGHAEWRQYVSQITDRITIDVRRIYPFIPTPSQPEPDPDNPSEPLDPDPQPQPGIQLIKNFQPGMYYVQIGAYSNAATANSEIETVDNSLPRAIMRVTVNIRGIDTNVTRVLIGPLNNAQSISVLQIYRTNYSDAFVHYGR